MSFRFRLGPFTFGRTGIRLSVWRRGSGVSIPLSGKGRPFGKIGFGPVSWYLGETQLKTAVRIAAILLVIGAIIALALLLFSLFRS